MADLKNNSLNNAGEPAEEKSLLNIKDLFIEFTLLDKSKVNVVNGINITLNKGESLGIVGESGSGKSQFVLSLMGLLAKNATVKGEILFDGVDILKLPIDELNNLRGMDISMIFQDPMTSLNPYLKIGLQMREVCQYKLNMSRYEAEKKAMEMLNLVGIGDAAARMHNYPHQLSGGMRQRVMIAMALLSQPRLLIADEPTTALDVTLQAQILSLLAKLRKEMQLSLIMITHDLGVVANLCEKIAIFYGGEIMEFGTAEQIFTNPQHPYTKALLNSIPRLDQNKNVPLTVIEGSPKVIKEIPNLCVFKDRCPERFAKCEAVKPLLLPSAKGNLVTCLKYNQQA